MSNLKLVSFAALVLLLAGCSQNTLPDPDPTDTTYGADDSMTGTSGMDGTDPFGGEEFGDDLTAGELGMVIYFEFDSSEIRAEDQDLVARHAMQLGNSPGARVRLEGHADERGSREYNIGLGERRAQAVRRILMIQGIPSDQISTVSFGEERPVAFGSSESDYAQNRRVEFKYTN
ncbi:MAG TPA: peptidoglycan-associated lipoprotein Pal [Woeseiaceae bacterium]|jgi:peptidoglycan-associated lipoprotein|nr:peptidoglycan-associated lipoprotein Pal [Woeseiaceae bacterium]